MVLDKIKISQFVLDKYGGAKPIKKYPFCYNLNCKVTGIKALSAVKLTVFDL